MPITPPPIERPLGHTAARGLAWSIGQLVSVKAVNFTGQVILAWLLSTNDYGYVGLALTVASFTSLIQQGGVKEVLVQRGHHFARWSGPALILSLITGTIGAALIVVSAPLASRFYHEPRITGLLLVLALGGFLNSLTLIPFAKVQRDLRFRFIAVVSLVTATFSMSVSVLLAWLGFGAYSFVLPIPLTAALYLAILWPIVRPPISFRAAFRRIKYFLGDNLLLLGVTFFWTITWQGDYIILGHLYAKEVVGLYYWAYILSLQSLYLLAETMANVLFPSLSRLKSEPQRQDEGFRRAARAIALIGIPACLAQAALARPAIHMLFKPQWYAGVPIVQILSLGMAFQVVGTPAISAIKAQGRFRSLLLLMIIYAAAFIAVVYFGSRRSAAIGAAVAVAVYLCISSLCSTYLALNRSQRAGRDVLQIYAVPFSAGLAAAAVTFILTNHMPVASRSGSFLSLLFGAMTMAAIYVPLARWFAPETWRELSGRFQFMLVHRSIGRDAAPREPVIPPSQKNVVS